MNCWFWVSDITAGNVGDNLLYFCLMENPLNKIALFQGLGITVVQDDTASVTLAMPLEGNTNDKGTMFAGSLYSLMVLAGWKLSINVSEAAGAPGDVVISDASVKYLRPVTEDCQAKAVVEKEFCVNAFGSGCCGVNVQICNSRGKVCADFVGEYRIVPEKKNPQI